MARAASPFPAVGAALALLLAGCVVVAPPPGPPGPPGQGGPVAVAPPPVTVAPQLVVITGTPVYYAANWPEDLFYFEGRYYRVYRGQWYWAATVRSGWASIAIGQVPRVVVDVRPGYREHGRRKEHQGQHGDDD